MSFAKQEEDEIIRSPFENLNQLGFTVIQILEGTQLREMSKSFEEAVRCAPELKEPVNGISLHDRSFSGTEIFQQLAGKKRKQGTRCDVKKKTLREYFDCQLLVPVRSGQETRTFSTTHLRYWKPHIAELSKIYAPFCLDENGLVKGVLPSLLDIQTFTRGAARMHSPMAEEEMAIYFPRLVGDL